MIAFAIFSVSGGEMNFSWRFAARRGTCEELSARCLYEKVLLNWILRLFSRITIIWMLQTLQSTDWASAAMNESSFRLTFEASKLFTTPMGFPTTRLLPPRSLFTKTGSLNFRGCRLLFFGIQFPFGTSNAKVVFDQKSFQVSWIPFEPICVSLLFMEISLFIHSFQRLWCKSLRTKSFFLLLDSFQRSFVL